MISSFRATLFAVVLLVSTGCAPAAPAGTSPDPAGLPPGAAARLEQRQASLLAALASREAERVVPFFAEDARLHVAGMPEVIGRDAIRNFYANVFRFLSASEMTAGEPRMSSGGDMAHVSGSTRNRFASPGGEREFEGKFLLVWERRGEEWMVAVYAISNDSGS
jgi:ketosteroid isomerase-like protein